MKKSLSVMVAASMVFSMFASVAAAETAKVPTTAQEKFDFLKAKGIFEGINDAGDAGLDQAMTRAQVAKILVKLAGLTEDAAAASVYTDIKGSDEAWAEGYIGAATKAGIFDGKAAGIFDPEGTFTTEELAKVLDVAAGIKVAAGTVKGEVSDWAKDYVASAVKAGLIAEVADYTKPALREVLVVSSFSALDLISVAKQDVIATATGIKKIEVKFGKAADKSKVAFAIKRDTYSVNVAKVTWNDANTVATLELAANLIKGAYEVTVTGATTEASVTKLAIEDEKVERIEFTSDKAAYGLKSDGSQDTQEVNFGIKIFNQYGENRVANFAGDLNITIAKGDLANVSEGKYKGTVTGSVYYNLNEVVPVSVVHKTSGKFVSANLTVSAAPYVAAISDVKLVKKDDKVLNVGADKANFWVVASFKDQYGNVLKKEDIKLDKNLYAYSTNKAVATLDAVANWTNDGDTVKIPVAYADAATKYGKGKTTFSFISLGNGSQANVEIEVVDTAKVDSISVSAPDYLVAGEKVEIPFNAVDQFGAEITKADDLNNGFLNALSVNKINNVQPTIKFEQDYVANKAKLYVDLTGVGEITDSATLFINGITSTNKVVNQSFTVKVNAKPVVITGIKDLNVYGAVDAQGKLKAEKVTVYDQYGRSKTAKDFISKYSVKLSSSEVTKVTLNAAKDLTLTDNTEYVVKALAEGASTVSAELVKISDGKTVSGSGYSFVYNVVKNEALTGYEVSDVTPLYAGGSTYTKDFVVNGLTASGVKVAVTQDIDYTVTTSTYLTVTGGKISATDTGASTYLGGDNKEKTFIVTVVGKTKDLGVTIQKDVKVSNVAPVITTVELQTKEVKDVAGTVLYKVTKESDGVVSIPVGKLTGLTKVELAKAAVLAKDQYGYDYDLTDAANKIASVVITPVTKDPASAAFSSIAGDNAIKAGDTLNVTVVTKDSKTISFKLIVKE